MIFMRLTVDRNLTPIVDLVCKEPCKEQLAYTQYKTTLQSVKYQTYTKLDYS